jgi:hypothetical protein
MIRTGRWSNQLIRQSLMGTRVGQGRGARIGFADAHLDHAHLPVVRVSHRLRGGDPSGSAVPHVGGLRDVWKSAAMAPEAQETSAQLRRLFDHCLYQKPSLEQELLGLFGRVDAELSGQALANIEWVRGLLCDKIAGLLGKNVVDGKPIDDGT